MTQSGEHSTVADGETQPIEAGVDAAGAAPVGGSPSASLSPGAPGQGGKRSWPRRVLRFLWRSARTILLIVLLVLIAAGSFVWWLTQTENGRASLTGTLVPWVSENILVGDLYIGRIDGPIFGGLTLHDVTVTDGQGRAAIQLERVSATYDIWPLLTLTVIVPTLEVEGLRVEGHVTPSGGLNLAELVSAAEEPAPESSGGIDLELQSISIRRSGFVMLDDRSGEAQLVAIDDLMVDGSFVMNVEGRMDVALGRVELDLSPPVALDAVLPVAFTELEVVIEGNTIGAELAELSAGNTGLSGLSATVMLDPTGRRMFNELRAQLPEVHIDPEEANQFVEGLNLLQPVDVRTSFSGPPEELAMRMQVEAGENEATLAFVLDITDPAVPGYSGAMEMVRFRPHEVVDLQGLTADVSAVLNVRGVGITPQDARANLMLDVGPSRVSEYSLEYAWVTAHATYGEFVLDGLELSGMGAFARVEAAGNLDGEVSMEIEASVTDLAAIAAVVPDSPVQSGSMELQLTLTGALPLELIQELSTIPPFDLVETIVGRIRLDGELNLRNVSAMGYSVERVDLELGSPPELGEEILAELSVRNFDAGDLAQIDNLQLDATLAADRSNFSLQMQDRRNQRTIDTALQMQWDQDTLDVRIERLNVEIQGLNAQIQNKPQASLRFDEAFAPQEVRLSDTSLSLNRALVALSGSWNVNGAISAFLRTEPIDLAAVNRVAGMTEDLSGTLALYSVVSGSLSSPTISATVSAEDVTSGPMEDLDASFTARLGGGELELTANAELGGRPLFAMETYEGGLPITVNLERGSYRIDQDRVFGVRGELQRFNLGRVLGELEATSLYDVTGDIQSSFDLRGSLSDPIFNVDVELSQLAFSYPLVVDEATGESQPTRFGGLEMVLAAEYTLSPRSRSEWSAVVQEMAGDALVSRDAIFGGSSVSGCPNSLLSNVDRGLNDSNDDDAESDARAARFADRPGLRTSLWIDRTGCPILTSNVFVDADLRAVLEDPEALVLWFSRLSGASLPAAQNRRASAIQTWMDGIRAGTLTRVGPLSFDTLPNDVRTLANLNSGVLETEIRASVDRGGGYLSMSSALDRLFIKGLPLVSLVSAFRIDNEATALDLVATVGAESRAGDLVQQRGFEAPDSAALRASLPEGVAIAAASARYDVNMGDIARGRTDFDRPVEARVQAIRFPIAALLEEFDLTDIGLTLPGEDDGLLVLRGADLSGYVDVTGTPLDPDVFGRVALRGLQTRPDESSTIGAEISFRDDEFETSFFIQDRRRSLLDGRVHVVLPDDWDALLLEPASLMAEATVQGWARAQQAQLRDVLPPQLVGAYLDEVGGVLDMNIAVEGPLAGPAIEGSFVLEDARLGIIPIGRRIDELDVNLELDGERLELSRFYVRDATGTASATGNLLLDGFIPVTMDFDAELQNFLVADPSGNGVFVSGDIRVDGSTQSNLLTTTIELDSLVVDVPDTAGSASYGPTAPPSTIYFVNEDVAPDQVGQLTPQILESSGAASFEVPIQVDINVRTTGHNELHQSLADLVFEVDLAVALRGASYSLRGAVRVPDGIVRVAGKQFELERGFVTFDGAVDTFNPVVDVRAVHYLSSDVAARLEPAANGEANVSVVIDGKFEELFESESSAIRLQSDPQMSQEDIIFVLLTGRPRDSSSEVEGDQQALATASSLAAGLLADRLLSETGIPIDTIRIDGDAQSGQAFARVEGGKYITEDIYVSGTYINSQDPRENDFEFALEWIILRIGSASLRTELRAGNKGNGGLELLWNLTRAGRRRVESGE